MPPNRALILRARALRESFPRLETPELIAKTKKLFPKDLSEAKDFFGNNPPEDIFSQMFPVSRPTPLSPEEDIKMQAARTKVIEIARDVIEKIRLEGVNAKLTPSQTSVYCSIVLPSVRPGILIQDDEFETFPSSSMWNFLEQPPTRDQIEEKLPSIGRIEFMHRDEKGWTEWNFGTGFLVADDVIMTNRHVAELFCEEDENGQWIFDSECNKKRRIDYCEESGNVTSCEFKIKKVLKMIKEPGLDLAILKVAKTSYGRKHPKPLVLASVMPDPVEQRNVYMVGYPHFEFSDETDEDLKLVFGDIYKDGVKRLQPGQTTGVQEVASELYHDCSASDGNSGSCIIDIGMDQVVGLHFSGIFGTRADNRAVALPMLKDDPDLIKAGVNFAK